MRTTLFTPTTHRRNPALLLALSLAVVSLPASAAAQCANTVGASLQVTDLDDGLTAADLASALVGAGVAISNVSMVGSNGGAGAFVDSAAVTGLSSGVILGSGCVKSAAGPNDSDSTATSFSLPGDADLDTLIPGFSTQDATVLEFDFVPDTNVIQARYVFSSEEYNEFVGSGYNDVFGLFVNGVNFALLPDNATVVSINNVNGGNPFGTNATNPAFFRNNDFDDPAPTLDIEPDGLTVVLTVTAPVNVGVSNHFKIAIADAGDTSYDSWIFVETGSFTATENCTNEIDDDGDGLIDSEDPDCYACGNGILDPGEACDDGNIEPDDGCSPSCQSDIENCTNEIDDDGDELIDSEDPDCYACGNGILDPGEACDDGNIEPGDGCSPSCQVECGNGEIDAGETCDDGNAVSGDCCSSACQTEPAGSPCADDGNVCTDDVCNDAGSCGVNNSAGCDDGVFCNGTDTCADGVCTHDDPPCPGGECIACSEETQACSFAPSSTTCTSDGDQCTDDHCDGAGSCTHEPIPLAPLCDWVVVGGSEERQAKVRTRLTSRIHGSVCADAADVGVSSVVDAGGSWALLSDGGTAARVRDNAVVGDGSFTTGGGCVSGFRRIPIFGTSAGPICCADGDVELPGGNPSHVIHACGTHALIGECADAKAQVPADVALLDALAATQPSAGAITVPGNGSHTLLVDGGLNVIDVDKIKIGSDGGLVIDAQGNSDAVVVLRIAHGLKGKDRATITLANGATPENVLLYVANGGCSVGLNNVGAGTLFCPEGKLRLRVDTQWVGALAGGSGVDIGVNVDVVHAPFLGLAE